MVDQEPEEVKSWNEEREVRRSFSPVERVSEGDGRVMLVERVVSRFEEAVEFGPQMAVLTSGAARRDSRKVWRTNCWRIVRFAGGWGMPGEKVVY